MRWMGVALCALWLCACQPSADNDGRRDGGVDAESPDGAEPDDRMDSGLLPDGAIARLNAIQVGGYHRSNWYDFEPALDPEYRGHARPLLGAQVTSGVRVFHLGFSPWYRTEGPVGGDLSHWGGAYVRNAFDDGDCVDLRLGIDAPQATCREINHCFEWVAYGSPDFETSERWQVGGARRLPTEHHAPIFFLIEPQHDMWSDELRACFEGDDLILRAIERTYWPSRLEYYPAVQFQDRVFKPSELRQDAATLPDAIREHGWPTMDELWGRYVFILLDRGEVRDAYRQRIDLDSPGLNMDPDDPHYFVVADDPEDPDAAFFSVPAAETDRVRELATRGFIVHAYSLDPDEIEAARVAGAHLLTALELDDIALDHAAVCNPVTSDDTCRPDHFARPSLERRAPFE